MRVKITLRLPIMLTYNKIIYNKFINKITGNGQIKKKDPSLCSG